MEAFSDWVGGVKIWICKPATQVPQFPHGHAFAQKSRRGRAMERRMWFFAVCFFALVLVNSKATAQIDGSSLTIGSSAIKLGDSKNRIISEMAKEYETEAVSPSQANGDIWLVKDKDSSSSKVVAAVEFDKYGRLASATKYWLPENHAYKPEDVVVAIYGVIDTFIKQGNKTCVIGAGERIRPGPVKETKIVTVRCGLETLLIGLNRLSDSVSVDVSETLTKVEEPKLR